jgi:hypothetical protein
LSLRGWPGRRGCAGAGARHLARFVWVQQRREGGKTVLDELRLGDVERQRWRAAQQGRSEQERSGSAGHARTG